MPEIKVNVVTIQSFRWSFLFASNKMLLYFFDNLFVYKYKKSYINIVIIHTAINNIEGVNVNLYINEIIELYKSFMETIIIDIAIKRENIYSAFPCPKLCDASLGSLAILFPM